MGNTTSQVLDNIVQGSNCAHRSLSSRALHVANGNLISRQRRGRPSTETVHEAGQGKATFFCFWSSRARRHTELLMNPSQDNSGTIEREEFLSLPQISSNPLATR